MTASDYVDAYLRGEGRGDTARDRELQQFAANHAAEIEAEFLARSLGRAVDRAVHHHDRERPVLVIIITIVGIAIEFAAAFLVLPHLINLHDDLALFAAVGVAVLMAVGGYLGCRLIAELLTTGEFE